MPPAITRLLDGGRRDCGHRNRGEHGAEQHAATRTEKLQRQDRERRRLDRAGENPERPTGDVSPSRHERERGEQEPVIKVGNLAARRDFLDVRDVVDAYVRAILSFDVLPAGDLGIVTAIQRLYRLRKRPLPKRVLKLGEAWKPYRSVASWYLWQTLREGTKPSVKMSKAS